MTTAPKATLKGKKDSLLGMDSRSEAKLDGRSRVGFMENTKDKQPKKNEKGIELTKKEASTKSTCSISQSLSRSCSSCGVSCYSRSKRKGTLQGDGKIERVCSPRSNSSDSNNTPGRKSSAHRKKEHDSKVQGAKSCSGSSDSNDNLDSHRVYLNKRESEKNSEPKCLSERLDTSRVPSNTDITHVCVNSGVGHPVNLPVEPKNPSDRVKMNNMRDIRANASPENSSMQPNLPSIYGIESRAYGQETGVPQVNSFAQPNVPSIYAIPSSVYGRGTRASPANSFVEPNQLSIYGIGNSAYDHGNVTSVFGTGMLVPTCDFVWGATFPKGAPSIFPSRLNNVNSMFGYAYGSNMIHTAPCGLNSMYGSVYNPCFMSGSKPSSSLLASSQYGKRGSSYGSNLHSGYMRRFGLGTDYPFGPSSTRSFAGVSFNKKFMGLWMPSAGEIQYLRRDDDLPAPSHMLNESPRAIPDLAAITKTPKNKVEPFKAKIDKLTHAQFKVDSPVVKEENKLTDTPAQGLPEPTWSPTTNRALKPKEEFESIPRHPIQESKEFQIWNYMDAIEAVQVHERDDEVCDRQPLSASSERNNAEKRKDGKTSSVFLKAEWDTEKDEPDLQNPPPQITSEVSKRVASNKNQSPRILSTELETQKPSSLQKTVEPVKADSREEKPEKDTKTDDKTAVLASQINDNVHALVVVSESFGGKVRVKETEKVVVLSGTEYEADEVLRTSSAVVDKSALLQHILRELEASHNAAIVLASGKAQQEACADVALSTLKALLAALKQNEGAKGTKHEAYLTAAALPTHETTQDLFATESAETKPILFGTNPIFGVCIMNLVEKPLRTEADADVLRDALRKSADSKGPIVAQVTLKQIKKTDANTEVFLCSLLMAFVKDQDDYLGSIHEKDAKVVPLPLFKDAFGGAARTVVVVAVSGDDIAVEGKMLSSVAKLRTITNKSPRSGNVARFVDFSNSELKRLKAMSATMKGISSLTRHKVAVQKVTKMVDDAEELLLSPEVTEAKLYSFHIPQRDVNSSLESLPSLKRRLKEEKLVPEHGLYSVVFAENAGVDSVGKRVVLKNGKSFDVTECIQYKGSVPVKPQSSVVDRLKFSFADGRNVAIYGMSVSRDADQTAQPTWQIFTDVLLSVLNEPMEGVKNTVKLSMCILNEDEVLGDLIGVSGRQPLVLQSSPLFGPVVQGVEMRNLCSGVDAMETIEKALAKAKLLLEDNVVVVAIAVLKQIRKDDVFLASLMASSSSDLRPYVTALGAKKKSLRTLFDHCSDASYCTTIVISYDAANVDEAEAQQTLRDVKKYSRMKKIKSRQGSVKVFIHYAKELLTEAKLAIGNASNGQDVRHQEIVLGRLQLLHEDHERLLAQPLVEMPMTYPVANSPIALNLPPEAVAEESRATIVAVHTSTRASRMQMDEVSIETSSAYVKVGSKQCHVDELVSRRSSTSMIRSSKIDAAALSFLKGQNVAVLTADMPGSSTACVVVSRIVHDVMMSIQKGVHVQMSIVAFKPDGTARDYLKKGAEFEMPIFDFSPSHGPTVCGARMEPLSDTLFDLYMNTAYAECGVERSMLAIFLLLKRGQQTLSSMLFTMAGKELGLYSTALAKPSQEYTLFRTAFGNSCHTAVVFGLTSGNSAVADEFLDVMRMLQKFEPIGSHVTNPGKL